MYRLFLELVEHFKSVKQMEAAAAARAAAGANQAD